MNKITLKDIAKEAGVSAMTVSKALNNKPGISPERRAYILQIAKQMNYMPNSIAVSLRSSRSKTIGVVLSDSSEMVTSKVLRGIQDGASEKDYNVIVSNTDHRPETEKKAVSTLMAKQIDGLILVAPLFYSAEDLAHLKSLGIPFILLMRKNDSFNVDSVINDNYLGGYQSIEHLVKAKCRQFQILALANSQSGSDREKGYLQAFKDFKIPETSVCTNYIAPSIDAGHDAVTHLLKSGSKFDALVCGCDTIAIGAMEALLDAGIRIPEDVKLIGYDGVHLGKYLRVPLSTIEQPLYQIGFTGVGILLDRIQYPDMAIRKVVLPSTLIARTSSQS